MSIATNKQLVRRFVREVFELGDEGAVDELLSARFTSHTWANMAPGTEGLKQAMRRIATGLSKVHMHMEDLIAEDDKVAVRLTARAVQSGPFMGLPASNKAYSIAEIHIFRIEGGRIAEHWHVADMLGLMQQLGALPKPGAQKS